MNEHRRSGTEIVDGLRGLAILVVFAYHLWLFSWFTPYFKIFGLDTHFDAVARTGYLGVDLFFVISGFCLFFPVARARFEGAKPIALGDYAYRRVIKIVPSYLIVLIATIAIALPRFGQPGDLVWPIVNHVLFFNNAYDDAFGRDNSVLWSLATEMQFYVVFPLLAWAFVRLPWLTAPLMIAASLAFRFGLASHGINHETVTRQVPAFLDTFGCGMLAAYSVVWLRTHVASLARFRIAFTLASIALGALGYWLVLSCNAVQYDANGRETWDLAGRTELSLVTCAFIVTACFSLTFWRRVVGNPVLTFLSLISYNLYLWHTLVGIWMWTRRVPYSSMPDVHGDDVWKVWYLAIATLVSVGISTAITYFIERPLLSTIKPQPFSFDWSGILRRVGVSARPPRAIAPAETNT